MNIYKREWEALGDKGKKKCNYFPTMDHYYYRKQTETSP
jgi:hypothetical protein